MPSNDGRGLQWRRTTRQAAASFGRGGRRGLRKELSGRRDGLGAEAHGDHVGKVSELGEAPERAGR